MIVVTGAAGFIGSCLIEKLNQENFKLIISVDRFDDELKNKNLYNKSITASIDFEAFPSWLKDNSEEIEFLFHLGAITDTTETNQELVDNINTEYSKKLWKICADKQIPMIYASSAATYGSGSHGFCDDESLIQELEPLNIYAQSKHKFDLWALEQTEKPYFWAGIKLFNVFGPNEWHKGQMSSMILQMHQTVKKEGIVKLYKSNSDEMADGEQKRDFIYVKDVVQVFYDMMHQRKNSGIYNLGTGQATSFNQVAKAIFNLKEKEIKIEYFDMPESLISKYQNYTRADIQKIKAIGIPMAFTDIVSAISDYILNHLDTEVHY